MNLFKALLIFFSFQSWALDAGPARLILDINAGTLQHSQRTPCLNSLATYSTSNSIGPNEYNECAISLCGSPNENPSAWITNANFSKNISLSAKNNVEALTPTINKLYDLAEKKNQTEISALKKIILVNGLKNFSKNSLTPSFQEELDSIIFKKYIKEIQDSNLPLANRFNVKVIPPEGADANFLLALNSYAEKYKTYVTNNYYLFLEKNLYTPVEQLEIAKKSLNDLTKATNTNRSQISPSDLSVIDSTLSELKTTIEKSDDFTFSSQVFFSKLDNVKTLIKYSVSSFEDLSSPPRCTAPVCEKVYTDFISKLNPLDNLVKIENMLKDPTLRQKSINHCKANLLAGQLEATNNEIAKKTFAKAKSLVYKNVLPRFSNHSRGILQKYLDNNLIMSSKNSMKLFSRSDGLEKFKHNAESFLNDDRETEAESIESAIRKSIVLNLEIDNVDPFNDSSSPCASVSSSNAWDSFLPLSSLKKEVGQLPDELKSLGPKDHIFVSDFSCNHEGRGIHTIAHEIGHAINHVFYSQKLSTESAKLYSSIRKCATDNYIDPQGNSLFGSQPGDSVYTEEDSADLFSFMAADKKNKDLFTCALLKPTYSNTSYTDLAFIFNEGDTHSSSFSRVIIEAINKGISLPVSCQRIIQKEQPKMSFKSCL